MTLALVKKAEVTPVYTCGSPTVECFIQMIRKELLDSNSFPKCNVRPDNLPAEARKALNEMRQWDVVFRPYDKGNGLCILEEADYMQRVIEPLNNAEKFEVVEDVAEEIQIVTEKITKWTEKYSSEPGMTKKIAQWVIPDNKCKTGTNYVNIKRHSEPPYKNRLISTGCGAHIENLSALTSWELKKCHLEYCLIDSAHFLAKLKHLNNTGTLHNHKIIHVSFDIVEMFPSIPKDFGLRQCRQNLDKREDPLFSTDCIIEALDITLSHNVTEFDGVLRKQKYGTGMGPKNSCPYADNSVDYIDQKIHSEDEGPECKPVSWSRFRDDIYTPWIYGLQALIIFFEWLNTLHPTIKFTMNHSIDEGTTCNCNAKSHSIGGIEYLE